MIEIRQTENYKKWFNKLKDRNAKARINIRIQRLSLGNPGDVKSIGDGISELRIDYGPGYRIYFVKRNNQIIILLAGGDKATQSKDIKNSREINAALED